MKTVFTKKKPDDFSKVTAIEMRDVMEKCGAKDGQMFAMNVGWVRSTGKRIITGYWVRKG